MVAYRILSSFNDRDKEYQVEKNKHTDSIALLNLALIPLVLSSVNGRVLSKRLPLTANCLLPLSGFE